MIINNFNSLNNSNKIIYNINCLILIVFKRKKYELNKSHRYNKFIRPCIVLKINRKLNEKPAVLKKLT